MSELKLESVYEGFPKPHQITGNPHRSELAAGCCKQNEHAGIGVPVINETTGFASIDRGDVPYTDLPARKAVNINFPMLVTHNDLDTLVHRFWLRRDFEVEIRLPRDMTVEERTSLGHFVHSLRLHGSDKT